MSLNPHSTKGLRVACAQMNSGADVASNLGTALNLLAQASKADVDAVLFPENFAQMPASPHTRHSELWQPENPGECAPVQRFLIDAAAQFDLTIIAGSVPIRVTGSNTSSAAESQTRPFSRSIVVQGSNGVVAHYDKLHLFDVDTGTSRYCESDDFTPGALDQLDQLDGSSPSNLVTIATDQSECRVGLTICYDLRFPELYRRLLNHGAQIFTVPAAFTYETGQQHWKVLLQARAIENQCYILAAGQCGKQVSESGQSRRTWGHSMIISPSGEVIASLQHDPGLLIGDVDLIQQAKIIEQFPAVNHRRLS